MVKHFDEFIKEEVEALISEIFGVKGAKVVLHLVVVFDEKFEGVLGVGQNVRVLLDVVFEVETFDALHALVEKPLFEVLLVVFVESKETRRQFVGRVTVECIFILV